MRCTSWKSFWKTNKRWKLKIFFRNDWNMKCQNPATKYMLKINNETTTTKLSIKTVVWWRLQLYLTFTCSKSTIEALEKRVKYVNLTLKTSGGGQWRLSGVFIVNLEHISHHLVVLLLWNLIMYLFVLCDLFYISIVYRFDGFKFHPERISTK